MLTSNGLLTIKLLEGKVKSHDYLHMLQTFAVKLMKLNMRPNFSFVQDNCSIHKTKEVLEYLASQNIQAIDWPARSPDLNIIETMWKVMSDIVYEDGQPKTLTDLKKKIVDAANTINLEKRNIIKNLYMGFRHRLTTVLKSNGCLFK